MQVEAQSPLNYHALLSRILHTVDQRAYLTPSSHIEPRQREAMSLIEAAIQGPNFQPSVAKALIRKLYEEGRIDEVKMLSALHVVAAHPDVADYVEAARLTGEQEVAALRLGGPDLQNNLASVDRHRGVIAWLNNHAEVAFEHFARALERQYTPENLGNVLCAMIRLGDQDQAQAIVDRVRENHTAAFVRELNRRIQLDPDLAAIESLELS